MAPPILHFLALSPPCQTVLLTAKIINLDMEHREVNLFNGDHLKEEFIKMNPQHSIPTLDDNGFILWGSHAISAYLIQKYAKNESLYPKDLETRALIDQYLHFEGEKVFVPLKNIGSPLFFGKTKELPESLLNTLKETAEILEKILNDKKWMVGHEYTLADISLAPTISCFECFIPMSMYKNVLQWLEVCRKELPGYNEIVAPASQKYKEIIMSILQQ